MEGKPSLAYPLLSRMMLPYIWFRLTATAYRPNCNNTVGLLHRLSVVNHQCMLQTKFCMYFLINFGLIKKSQNNITFKFLKNHHVSYLIVTQVCWERWGMGGDDSSSANQSQHDWVLVVSSPAKFEFLWTNFPKRLWKCSKNYQVTRILNSDLRRTL